MEITKNQKLNLQIDNEADIGVCRRKSASAAKDVGFNEVKVGEIAILVTEMVSNVIKHGGKKGRLIFFELITDSFQKGIEIFCIDSGPGISDVNKAISDGYTEQGTLGVGLGAIRRFSDEFEFNSKDKFPFDNSLVPELSQFTNYIRALKWLPSKQWIGTNRNIEIGAATLPKPGEKLNGDCFMYNHLSPTKTVAAVIDGLGHGTDAHMASQMAKEQLLLKSDLPVNNLLQHTHLSLRNTRGAVIGLVSIDTELKKLAFSGIGNIEGILHSMNNGRKSLLSYGGIIGHNIRTPRVFEYEFSPGDTLCMYSDGIKTRWDCDDINFKGHPQQMAEEILNKFSRKTDDATVLIIRYN